MDYNIRDQVLRNEQQMLYPGQMVAAGSMMQAQSQQYHPYGGVVPNHGYPHPLQQSCVSPQAMYHPDTSNVYAPQFNQAKLSPSRIEHNVDVAMGYGDMPSTMLMAKYEETDMGPDEDLVEDYIRNEIIDRQADAPMFEHERPRGPANASTGKLQLQYEGHRGTAVPWQPELFLGFGGDTDRDPRGHNVAPDMKTLTEQERFRAQRYIRFSKDGCEQITGGGRSEFQLMADQQKLQRNVRDRLKIFNRQLDCKRNGMRRVFKHKSDVAKQILVQSYGDYVKDYALNPQRRANIMCNQIIRDTSEYRSESQDQDYAVAKYTQTRRMNHKAVGKPTNDLTAEDGEWSSSDQTKTYRAAAILMSNLVRLKKQSLTDKTQNDFENSKGEQVRKQAPIARDLALILRSLAREQDFTEGDVTMTVKTAPRPQLEHQARLTLQNHLAPAHHYLNAEILYKSVKPGADTRKVADMILGDATEIEDQDETTRGKSAKQQLRTGKANIAEDIDYSESQKTVNYKQLLAPEAKSRREAASGENFKSEGDDTQLRRPTHTLHRNPHKEDTARDINFANNTQKERLTGRLGSKYTMRSLDRDERRGEIKDHNGAA